MSDKHKDLRKLDNHPDLMDARCQTMETFDGQHLRTALWPATVPNPKGTICLLHGRAEFIEKYYEVICELRQKGFAVATFDWRGQGASDRMLSDPLKGHVRRFSDYGRDLDQFMKQIVLPDTPPPHFALAHSMGGLILLSNLPQMRTLFERALITTPLLELAPQRRCFMGLCFQQQTIRNLAGFLRYMGRSKAYMLGAERKPIDPLGFEGNPLTSDGPRYDRNRQYLIDFPELAIAGPTSAWLHEICKAMDQLQSSDVQAMIHTPTLIITASQDTIVSTSMAEQFAATARAAYAVGIAGSRHEVMMERTILRQQFWAAFDTFIPGSNILEMADVAS
nr:alpha/beta hydrolase [uncultured Cohaesibacter sp.]